MEIKITINLDKYEYKVSQGKHFVAHQQLGDRSGSTGTCGASDKMLKVDDLVREHVNAIYSAIKRKLKPMTGQTGVTG